MLTAVFASVALSIAVYLGLAREDASFSEAMPGDLLRAILGAVIGGLSAMMGIGGGSLSVSVMRLSGFSIHRAVGTAAALGLVIALPGAAGFALEGLDTPGLPPLSLGYVNLLGAALIFPVAVCVAPSGARRVSSLTGQASASIYIYLIYISLSTMTTPMDVQPLNARR